jgi:hypothetical protein
MRCAGVVIAAGIAQLAGQISNPLRVEGELERPKRPLHVFWAGPRDDRSVSRRLF